MRQILLFLLQPLISAAIECYSGSQLQVIDCTSISCIKQTLGFDTVRYCDGIGVSSICQTYGLFEICENIPNLGFVCCCSGNLCNSGIRNFNTLPLILSLFVAALYNVFIR